MKQFYIYFLCLWAMCFTTIFPLQAGCPTGNIILSSQAQIDAFPTTYAGCTVMPYDIKIEESVAGNITNLNGLSQLTAIGGTLIIQYNTALPSLAGLNALTSVGGTFYIFQNSALASLTDLSALTSISVGFYIHRNRNLTNLIGLNGFTTFPINQ